MLTNSREIMWRRRKGDNGYRKVETTDEKRKEGGNMEDTNKDTTSSECLKTFLVYFFSRPVTKAGTRDAVCSR